MTCYKALPVFARPVALQTHGFLEPLCLGGKDLFHFLAGIGQELFRRIDGPSLVINAWPRQSLDLTSIRICNHDGVALIKPGRVTTPFPAIEIKRSISIKPTGWNCAVGQLGGRPSVPLSDVLDQRGREGLKALLLRAVCCRQYDLQGCAAAVRCERFKQGLGLRNPRAVVFQIGSHLLSNIGTVDPAD